MNNKFFILVILSVITFSGCRKGDEDPFFSIYSREKRLCGDWNASTYNYMYEELKNQVSTYKRTMVCTNGVFTNKYDGDNTDYNGTYTIDIIINKNGTYKKNQYLYYKEPFDTNFVRLEEGNWYFVNKNKSNDYKNKEVVGLQPNSIIYSSTDYYNLINYNPYFYEIVMLKNKEIKLKRAYSETQDSLCMKIDETYILVPK